MAERNAPSAFDAAFAELDAALIDLDGDGVPDVAVPQQSVQPSNAMAGYARAGQTQPTNAMAGSSFPQMVANNPRGWGNAPPVPEATLSNATPTVGENAMSFFRQQGPIGERIAPVAGAVLDYGPELAKGYVGQIDRTAQALSDATNDPSLANVTNAGAQTAVTFGRPVVAGGIFGAGMLEAARRDFAPDVFSPANALTRRQTRDQEMKDREAARQREAEANRIRLESEARRAEADAALKREAEAEKKRVDLERQKAEQDEYDRAVERSEGAYNREMARVRRFSDSKSYTKEVSDRVGGFAPFVGGLVGGKVARMAGRGLGGQLVGGAAGGIAATSAPLFEDAYFTDIDNPERAAYMARGAELPPGHPRKQEFLDYGRSLPEENPVRTHATESLYNPVRLGLSGVEGALAGMLGGDAANALARPFRRNAMGQPPTPAQQARTIVRATDKNGRVYHYDAATGNRVPNP